MVKVSSKEILRVIGSYAFFQIRWWQPEGFREVSQLLRCFPLDGLRYKRCYVVYTGNFKVRRKKLSFMKVNRRKTNIVGTGNISRGKKEPRSTDTMKRRYSCSLHYLLIFAALEESMCPVKRLCLAPSFLQMACGGLRGWWARLFSYRTCHPAVSRWAEAWALTSCAGHTGFPAPTARTHLVISTQSTQAPDEHPGPRWRRRGGLSLHCLFIVFTILSCYPLWPKSKWQSKILAAKCALFWSLFS